MATTFPPHSMPTPLSYANAVKRLSFSQVSHIEKINICRHLLSSQYHPDPSAPVLNFLCTLIAKEAPSVDKCYTIRDSTSIPEHAVHYWNLFTHTLLRSTQGFDDHSDHREAPLIPNAVLVQGGLHLLRGSPALQKAAVDSLHLIIKEARYSQHLETHTWLFCAVARAEGPGSVLDPLRTALLPRFSLLLSREHDGDCAAAAAAAVASQAVPSWLASETERVVVHSIRASPRIFHSRFAAWVLQSDASLPQAVQFLLRAYARHPLKTNEERSSAKRSMWEPARRDAFEFFGTISDHVLQAIRADGDQRLWDEQIFRCRMRTIEVLYLIGSENAAYLPLQDQLSHEGVKRKKARKGVNRHGVTATGLHGLLHELLDIARSLHLEAENKDERVKFTFQAIGAIAKFSIDAVTERLPDLLASCFTTKKEQLSDTNRGVSANITEFFCALVLRHQQSRALDKFLRHLMKIGSLRSLTAVLRQKRVQEALGVAFSRLREAEAQACVQSLVSNSHPPARDLSALTLLSSLLLETIAPPFIQLVAATIASQAVELLVKHPVDPEMRQCRVHLLSSFFIVKTTNNCLSLEEEVRVAMLRLACLNGAEEVSRSEKLMSFESVILDALSTEPESRNAVELCSNLRCLATLAHYSFQNHKTSDDRMFISRVLQVTFAQFRVLHDLLEKSDTSKKGESNTLYDSVSLRQVLPWLGSLGNLLTRFSFLEEGNTDPVPFFSQALQFFPATHPFWNELSEDRKWGPPVVKAACFLLKRLSRSSKCAKDIHPCPLSVVLVSISSMPPCFFVGPDHENLLHLILHCMLDPCCSSSHHNTLKACLNLSDTSGFQKVLSAFCQQGGHVSVQKAKLHSNTLASKRRSISPYEHVIVTMRVVASQTPEKQFAFLSKGLATLLRKAILGLKTLCQTDVQLLTSSPERWYKIVGALLDLRANLKSAKDIGAGSDEMSKVEDATAECIRVALPLCVESLSKEASEHMSHSEAAEYMLSAMLKGPSPVDQQIFSNEECDALHHVLRQTYLPYLLHPQYEKQQLAALLFLKLPAFEGNSNRGLCQVVLSLMDTALRRVLRHLPSVLRGDKDWDMEAVNKLILTATSLTKSSARLCNGSAFPFPETSESCSKGMLLLPGSHAHGVWSYDVISRILYGLDEFVGTWSSAAQELPATRMTELQTSILLNNSDSLVCTSMKACLQSFAPSRSWSREDLEKVVLLTRLVVERVCSCETFLRNEGDVLMNALRICRIAVKRHSGLVPTLAQVTGVLLRRGIGTGNMVIIAAVREAVEYICTFSKTWEVLSALLADCSTALDETMGTESRREAEKSTAVLFKAVGEHRAQQILTCLKDGGRESLRIVWELFSDKLHYAGR